MKAVYFEDTGSLKYGEFPDPSPQKGEALVAVKACSLNHLDIWLRKDKENKRNIPMPHIPGSDASGIIEEINGDSCLETGQEVVMNPSMPCGACVNCMQGKACERVNIFGVKNQGSYAEYVTVPVGQLYQKPENISFQEAAAFPLTFLTAWHMLAGRACLAEGEDVFIWGASGGLGSAAVKIARHLGARVIAAAKSEENASRIRKMGADDVVVYTKENVGDAVRKLTNGAGVDVVFESVGQKTWGATLSILKPFGRVVIAGTTSGDIATNDLSDIYVRQLSIFGARMGTREEFGQVLELVSAGKLKPVNDGVFPLSQAAAAQKKLEEGMHVGKIVLEM